MRPDKNIPASIFLKTILIVCLVSLCPVLFLQGCDKTECNDVLEPVLHFSETSMLTLKDTVSFNRVYMNSIDRNTMMGSGDLNNKKIRLSPSADVTELYFSYDGPTIQFDTVILNYNRTSVYTGNECGFRINVSNIRITNTKLHVAKQVTITSPEPQLLKLVY